jgi:hypothetical protein
VWDAPSQTFTYYQDGVKIGSVYIPKTQLSGGLKGLLVMCGNAYDHDPGNSIIGLLGPMALASKAWSAADVAWLWNNGLGRQFVEYN